MAGKKQKCPDCRAKLKKGPEKGSRSCPECFLLINTDGTLVRHQGEVVEDPGPNEGQEHESKTNPDLQEDREDGSGGEDQGGSEDQQEEDQEADQEHLTQDSPPGKWDLNFVSKGLMAHPTVTVYAWSVGIRGFRYGTRPTSPRPEWQKVLSGVEAYQFLRHIKKRNRKGRLENRALPQGETLKELMNI